MSKRHEQKCACGAILKLPAELDTGLCLCCLQRGECAPPVVEVGDVEDYEWEPQEVKS